MSRALNLTRPVRCAKCPARFVRRRGNERLCQACKRPDVKAKAAARRAYRSLAAPRVPERLTAEPGTRLRDRQQSVKVALNQARRAVAYAEDLDDEQEQSVMWRHALDLIDYARRVAAGDVPDSEWQLRVLGFLVAPCTGRSA